MNYERRQANDLYTNREGDKASLLPSFTLSFEL
jgi:hypothetical protein